MRTALLLPLLALAACHAEKPDWAKEDRRAAVPTQACDQVRKAVEQLRKSVSTEITDKGEATLPTAAWTAMTAEQHDGFVRTLAFNASCAAGTQSEAQTVVVRGDDGSELARRSVNTRVDTSEMLRH